VDNRHRQDLDNYITGHYGEDQFRSDLWSEISAHQQHWECRNNPWVYEYDPTDDGPEVEIIRSVCTKFPELGGWHVVGGN
jgi:hypothetical protein